MAGARNKKKAGVFLGLFLISAVLFLASCAPQRVSSRQPPHVRQKGVYHVVERHQTLYRICKTYGVDINRVASLNRIPDHGRIDVGQRIFIPGATKVLKVEIYIDDVVQESGRKRKDFVSQGGFHLAAVGAAHRRV